MLKFDAEDKILEVFANESTAIAKEVYQEPFILYFAFSKDD